MGMWNNETGSKVELLEGSAENINLFRDIPHRP